MRKLLLLLILVILTGCQGIVSPTGEITGITVPAGCKASWIFSYPGTMSISGSCDETGPSPPGGATVRFVPVAQP